MIFKDNFTENNLLFAQPVHFIVYQDEQHQLLPLYEFNMQMPTFKQFYFDDKMRNFVSIINAPLIDLQEQFAQIAKFNSVYGLIQALILLNNKYTQHYLNNMASAFSALGMELKYGEPTLISMQINGNEIDEKIFTRITQIILLALSLKKQSDFIDDPQLRAYQEKIDRIKRQNKPIKGMESGDFKDAFMILTYEFGYKPDEIMNMTQYAINLILGYTGKSIRYKTTLIAAGNGNTKKVKFITDKGK